MNREVLAPHPVEALSALIDGEIGAADRAPLEAHLEACAGCRDLLEDLRAIDRAVAAEPVPSPPPDLTRRIATAIPRREDAPSARASAPASRPFLRNPMPLAAAASLAVATLVWLAWPGGRPVPEPAQVADSRAPASTSPTDRVAPAAPPSTPAPAEVLRHGGLVDRPASPPSAPGAAPEKEGRATPVAGAPRAQRFPAPDARKEVAPSEAKRKDEVRPAAPSLDTTEAVARPTGVTDDERRAYSEAMQEQPQEPRRESVEESSQVVGAISPINSAAAEPGGPPAAMPGAAPPAGAPERMAKNPIPPPWPRLLAGPYTVRMMTVEAMRVESGAYVCSVPLQPEDARRLTGLYGDLRLMPGGRSRSSELMQTIRVTAAPAPGAAAPKPSASEAPAPAPGLDPPPVEVPPEVRAYLLALVRDRYRAALEQQCGPLPQ